MTAKELGCWIDKEGTWEPYWTPLRIAIKIKDAKMSYGRPLGLISPKAVSGECWVDLDALRIDDPPPKGGANG